MSWPGVLHHYRDRVDVQGEPVTLLEGNTPLIHSPRLAEWACPGADLWIKFEGLNPTGSFKDRGMTAAMTQAKHDGAQTVICASTGNTAASAAAYAARAGMRCVVVIPEGKVALGKLAGAIAYGGHVIQIRGSFDDGLRLVRAISETSPITLVNSVNPARVQGQKTASFEIVDVLGDAPDWLCLPVGNAGNITSYWLGFREYLENGPATKAPRLLGAQAAGSAPILANHAIESPETFATAIRIGHPARWCEAWNALRESCGQIWAMTDDEIREAYHQVAQLEGIFCEPSSAAGLSALRKSVRSGKLDPSGKRIVVVLTGHGLKDPENATAEAQAPKIIEATSEALAQELL